MRSRSALVADAGVCVDCSSAGKAEVATSALGHVITAMFQDILKNRSVGLGALFRPVLPVWTALPYLRDPSDKSAIKQASPSRTIMSGMCSRGHSAKSHPAVFSKSSLKSEVWKCQCFFVVWPFINRSGRRSSHHQRPPPRQVYIGRVTNTQIMGCDTQCWGGTSVRSLRSVRCI